MKINRAKLLKSISFAIGCAGTVKPELLAIAALEVIESKYELREKYVESD